MLRGMNLLSLWKAKSNMLLMMDTNRKYSSVGILLPERMNMTKLSECEEQVMAVIWTSEKAMELQPIRAEVNERFNHEWASQTVSTYLQRLCKKEYIRMERKGRCKYYYPEVPLKEYRKEKLRSLVDVLYGGDMKSVREDL